MNLFFEDLSHRFSDYGIYRDIWYNFVNFSNVCYVINFIFSYRVLYLLSEVFVSFFMHISYFIGTLFYELISSGYSSYFILLSLFCNFISFPSYMQ